MGSCKLCEKKPVETWFGTWCVSCRKIKHYLNLYDERVIEILDSVLSRTDAKQEEKIKALMFVVPQQGWEHQQATLLT